MSRATTIRSTPVPPPESGDFSPARTMLPTEPQPLTWQQELARAVRESSAAAVAELRARDDGRPRASVPGLVALVLVLLLYLVVAALVALHQVGSSSYQAARDADRRALEGLVDVVVEHADWSEAAITSLKSDGPLPARPERRGKLRDIDRSLR